MRVYVDVSPLYDLGMVGEMELLATLDGDLVIPDVVRKELTVEPAATNLERLFEDGLVERGPDLERHRADAMGVLGADAPDVDIALIAGILSERDGLDRTLGADKTDEFEEADGTEGADGADGVEEADEGEEADGVEEADRSDDAAGAGIPVGLISDDRRLRRVADGLGATVSGTFGVVTQAALVDKYFSSDQAKRVIRRTDNHGVVTTGPLREQAIGDVGNG